MRRLLGVLLLALCLTGCGKAMYDADYQQPVDVVPVIEMTAPPIVPSVQTETAVQETTSDVPETATETVPPTEMPATETMPATVPASASLLSSPNDIDLHDTDGKERDYVFTYNGKEYTAIRTWHHWRILDSYEITNAADMHIICEALCAVQQIPSADGEGWRTPEDMVYEWSQHNLAYAFLPEGSSWRRHAKDVDFDPDDQGRSLYEIYRDRKGS